jgi:alpha-N-arabinofuranosidase
MTVALDGFGALVPEVALQLRHPDPHAVNTRDRPDEVAPAPLVDVSAGRGGLDAVLAPASWNTIVLRRA